jgi:hypothetical protein
MMAVTERLSEEAEEDTSIFVRQVFDKQLARHRQAFDHFIVSPQALAELAHLY